MLTTKVIKGKRPQSELNCSYKGYANSFLAKGYQLLNPWIQGMALKNYLCYCFNLVCFNQKVDLHKFCKLHISL